MNTETLSSLEIHKLSKDQYERELAAGHINTSAVYLTTEEETNHKFTASLVTNITNQDISNWNNKIF